MFFFLQVDVTGVDPIPAFCSSDEEGEDRDALLFLPIAPDVIQLKIIKYMIHTRRIEEVF